MIDAAKYKTIKLFLVDRVDGSTHPLDDFLNISVPWLAPGVMRGAEVAVGPFAASCWYFGRDLYDGWSPSSKVPLGLILSSLGGTKDEWWSSPTALAKCPQPPPPPPGPVPKCKPGVCYNSGLWNAMIHPMLGLSFRGVVWYQVG